MANVPYSSGAPDVLPQSEVPQDYQNIHADPSAFGGQLAQAGEQAGQDVSKVGDFFGQIQTDDAVNGAMTTVNQTLDHFRSLNGADALNAQAETRQSVDEAFANGREGLTGARQQYLYDQTVRSFQQRYVNGMIASHADEQAKVFAAKTAQDSTELALQGIANVADNPDQVDGFRENLRSSLVKAAQLQYGNDPGVADAAVTKADQLAYKTQAETVAVKDPVRAQQIIEQHKDTLGPYYSELSDKFRGQVIVKSGDALRDTALAQAGNPVAGQAQQGQAAPPGLAPPSPNSIGNVKTSYGAQTGLPDFQQPATPVDGVVLAANNLRSNYRGLTIEQIGQKWEGTANYPTWVKNVTAATGLAPNAVPNMDDPGQMSTLLHGVSVAEKSHADQANFSPDVIQTGVTQAMSGRQPVLNPSTLKASAYDYIQKSGASDEVKQHAFQGVNQQYQQSLIASDMDTQAKKQASDQAEGKWVDQILTNPTGLSTADIAKDQGLSPQSKILMSDLLAKHLKNTDDGTASTYGAGFTDAMRKVTAAPNDPNKITDPNQLLRMALPGDDGTPAPLTLAGAEKLRGMVKENQTAEGVGENQKVNGALAYLKHRISFEADLGYGAKQRDPAGEDLYNTGAIPSFFSQYQAAKAAGNGQVPADFWSQKNLDTIVAPIKRTEAQVQRDMQLSNAGIDPTDPTAPRIPMKVQTQADFDALPAGAQFINPADGKVMIKNKPPQAPQQ